MLPRITEDELRANEARRLAELAGRIRATGKSSLEIARACGLDKRTVIRARQGKPVKSDAQARIEYCIKQILINQL